MRTIQGALYARVSSDQQAQAQTIQSQLTDLRARVEADGVALSAENEFIDEGYSGSTLVRPDLERLRDVVVAGVLDRLYVHSPDRLARKYAYQVVLVDELQRAGVEVIFLNHELGRSPEDDLLLQVQGMIAEYERAKILERSRRGKRHKAQTGAVNVLSAAPYGYHYVTLAEGGGQARYEVCEEQAQIVRQVFTWVGRQRLSIGEVCRRLRKQGTPTRTGKTWWDRTSVWGMLKNPAYKGQAGFGKTRAGALQPRLRAQRGRPLQPRRARSSYDVPATDWLMIPVPAIVGEDLFAVVQTQLEENRRRARTGRRGARYLLQGLLVCSCCGYAYYGKAISPSARKGHPRDYAYYRCIGSDAYRFGGQRVCFNTQVRTDRLEEAVWQQVCQLLEDPQRLGQEYERRLQAAQASPGEAETARVERQISKLRQGIARLIDGYTEGYIDKSEFEPRIRRFKERLAALENQAEQLREHSLLQAQLHLIIGRLEEFSAKVKAGLGQLEWHGRRELIRTLVKRVEIDREQVNVVFRIEDSMGSSENSRFLQHCRGRDLPDALQHRLE
ncbi:MAG: recombinase family protein [Shimia sp.]|nr:recombinase family protein [Shimia sp.]